MATKAHRMVLRLQIWFLRILGTHEMRLMIKIFFLLICLGVVTVKEKKYFDLIHLLTKEVLLLGMFITNGMFMFFGLFINLYTMIV